MTTAYAQAGGRKATLAAGQWATLGLLAAAASIVAVLAAQFVALTLWPDARLFAPLDNYARTALFTLVPALGATVVFAWLTRHRARPVRDFVIISAVLLGFSFIPDYLLPVPHRTLLASSIAAFLHIVAAAVIVGVLVAGYRRRRQP